MIVHPAAWLQSEFEMIPASQLRQEMAVCSASPSRLETGLDKQPLLDRHGNYLI